MMEIQYLTYFQKILAFHDRNESNPIFVSAGLRIEQIERLEKHFFPEGDKQFPVVLRELLFLCGYSSPYFDAGCVLSDRNTEDIDSLLRKQHSNPYFNYREKHDWPPFFEQKDVWTLFTVYESSDCFWFIDFREQANDPKLYFFDTEALYEGESDNIILPHIDQEQLVSVPLSQMIVEISKENIIFSGGMDYSEVFQSLYQATASEEILHRRFLELVRYSDLEGLQYFLGKGVGLAYHDYEAIWLAAEMRNTEALSLLLDCVKNETELLEDFLLSAIVKDMFQILWIMLDNDLVSQQAKDKGLAFAAALNKVEILETLLLKGACINANDVLPLSLALRNKHSEIINILAYKDTSGSIHQDFAFLFREILEKNNLSWLVPSAVPSSTPKELITKHEQQLKDMFGKYYHQHLFDTIEI